MDNSELNRKKIKHYKREIKLEEYSYSKEIRKKDIRQMKRRTRKETKKEGVWRGAMV
jgi:hypothetical protein